MAMELGEKYPFSVDTWSLASRRKRHHFLTHAHKDHTSGLDCHVSFPIFCTSITAKLVLLQHPKFHRSIFVELEVEEPKLIEDQDGSFTVTAYDANHCPGAVMFLFEGNFGNVLHTGDCRLTTECYMRIPRRLFAGSLDCVFLDCTFGKEVVKMPIKEEAIRQVMQCIWNHPQAPVIYLACDLLGQEMLLTSISNTFGLKIYVDRHSLTDYFGTLSVVAPDLLTDDPQSTRFHICEGFPKLYERAKQKFAAAHVKGQPEPLFIRPSAQWYTYGERLEGVGSGLLILEKIYQKTPSITQRRAKSVPLEAERDPFGIWHVCFSMHSSQEELDTFLFKLCPKQVFSTSANCKATELSYVRSLKCSEVYRKTELEFVGSKSISEEVKVTTVDTDAAGQTSEGLLVEFPNGRCSETTLPGKESLSILPLASPNKNIPLFGMAVAGVPPSPPLSFASEDSLSENEDGADCATDCSSFPSSPSCSRAKSQKVVEDRVDAHCLHHENSHSEVQNSTHCNTTHENESLDNVLRKPQNATEQSEPYSKDKGQSTTRAWECSRSSPDKQNIYSIKKCVFGESTRRIFRSMHIPIPRPLPSLLEIDRENKRYKFDF